MVVLGQGSYGIVISNPRLPIHDENYEDVIELNHVSKILYETEYMNKKKITKPSLKVYFEFEYDNIIKLSNDYPNIFNSEYFVLPIKGGILDKKKFVDKYNNDDKNYNFEWLSNSTTNIKILNSLLEDPNDIYQIIYEKGEKISSNIDNFMIGIKNIFDIIIISTEAGFFFDDIKLENLVLHDNKIKMIDYSYPIDTNLTYQKIISLLCKSKLKCFYYFPYDVLSNIILYKQINKINLLGKFSANNYYSLLNANFVEFENNVKYKLGLLKKLQHLFDKYHNGYKKEIMLINSNKINLINCIDDLKIHSEIKNISISDFVSSILLLLLYKNDKLNIVEFDYNKNLINEIFIKYDEFIGRIFPNQIEFKDKITFLLKNINLHSFSFIIINWIDKFITSAKHIDSVKKYLTNIFDIIILLGSNYFVIDDNIYFTYTNDNIEEINNIFFFENTIL